MDGIGALLAAKDRHLDLLVRANAQGQLTASQFASRVDQVMNAKSSYELDQAVQAIELKPNLPITQSPGLVAEAESRKVCFPAQNKRKDKSSSAQKFWIWLLLSISILISIVMWISMIVHKNVDAMKGHLNGGIQVAAPGHEPLSPVAKKSSLLAGGLGLRKIMNSSQLDFDAGVMVELTLTEKTASIWYKEPGEDWKYLTIDQTGEVITEPGKKVKAPGPVTNIFDRLEFQEAHVVEAIEHTPALLGGRKVVKAVLKRPSPNSAVQLTVYVSDKAYVVWDAKSGNRISVIDS